jgi:hypothetical protein
MHVEIGAEAALIPKKEYISGIFVAVHPADEEFLEEQNFNVLRNRSALPVRSYTNKKVKIKI